MNPRCFHRTSFDEAALVEAIGGPEFEPATLEELAQTQREIGGVCADEAIELSGEDYFMEGDPAFEAGLYRGQVEILEALIRLSRPQQGQDISIDLTIVEHKHEIELWIEPPAPAQPALLIEDQRLRPDPESAVQAAIELRRAEGLSMPDIASRLGLRSSTLGEYFRKRGLKLSEFGPSQYRSSRPKRDLEALAHAALELKQHEPALSYRQLADRLDVPSGTLSHALSKTGIRLRRPDQPIRKVDKDDAVREAIHLRENEGLPQHAIAARLGISQGRLNGILLEAGVVWAGIPVPSPVFAKPPPLPPWARENDLSRPPEPHLAVFSPEGRLLRCILISADGDVDRAIRKATEWLSTFVATGAKPPGTYLLERPDKKSPIRLRLPDSS